MKRTSLCHLAPAVLLAVLSMPVQAEKGCPAGYQPDGNELISNGTFANGYADFTAPGLYQAPLGQYPFDDNGTTYPHTGIGVVTGAVDDGSYIVQSAFPGEGSVPAAGNWLAYNGNDPGAPTTIWQQQVSNVTAGSYRFSAYFSNALKPGEQATDLVAPMVSFSANGIQIGDDIPVCDAGGGLDPVDNSCAIEASEDKWRRLGVVVDLTSTSVTLTINDAQITSSGGNDFAMTAVSFQRCVPTGLDSDGDGVIDSIDIDDDNDGIKDVDEGADDFDGDGHPNQLDLDADNDGLPDIIEALGSDVDNDGRVDGFTDANGNGYHDVLESAPWELPDTDSDGARDFLDLDSDNDSVFDLREAGLDDSDANGIVDNFTDSQQDGWDAGARQSFSAIDSDGNGVPDYRQTSVAGAGSGASENSTGSGLVRTQLDGGLGSSGLIMLGGLGLLWRRRCVLSAVD